MERGEKTVAEMIWEQDLLHLERLQEGLHLYPVDLTTEPPNLARKNDESSIDNDNRFSFLAALPGSGLFRRSRFSVSSKINLLFFRCQIGTTVELTCAVCRHPEWNFRGLADPSEFRISAVIRARHEKRLGRGTGLKLDRRQLRICQRG